MRRSKGAVDAAARQVIILARVKKMKKILYNIVPSCVVELSTYKVVKS